MPVMRTYGCPECEQQFSFLHMNRDEPAPEHCPKCGSYMGDEPQPIPTSFNIGTWKGKTVDKTYRQIEEASEIRAELSGDPNQKITNLKDNLREGDVAAIAPSTSSQYKEAVGSDFNHWSGGSVAGGVEINMAEAMANANAGRTQGTGQKAMQAIQDPGGMLAPMADKLKGFKASWQR